MSEHTPGPWNYNRKNWRGEYQPRHWFVSGGEGVDEDGDEAVCVSTAVCVVEGNDTSWPVCEANAQLIAAAPRMFDECKRSLVWAENVIADHEADFKDTIVLEAMRIWKRGLEDAIAQAEGRETASK